MYLLGMFVAVMIGGALGQALAEKHGWRRTLPLVALLTVLAGLAIGWSLNGELQAIEASSHT
jgi:predicted MFS family arabinose efflux permease